MFPIPNGVVVHCDNKKVISTVDGNGQRKLNSFPEKNKVVFFHFPFARGLQYFFCGIYAFLSAFVLGFDMKQKKSDTKNMRRGLIMLGVVAVFAVLFAVFVLGFLPGWIGYLIVPYYGSTILRNATIMLFKVLVFVLLMLAIRVVPGVNELFRFNRALDVASLSGDTIRGKKKKCPSRPTNFLNFIVFVFILDFIVVTLCGAGFGFWFNLFFHLAIFLLCISVAYEILAVMELCPNWVKNISFITSFLVYAKPSTTHIETALVGITEINLLNTQKERQFMGEETKNAFAVVYNEVKNKLATAGITEKSETDWLIATVLGKNRAEIKLVSFVTDKQYQDIMKATTRRARGESLDNIFGFTEFYGLTFDVNKKVLTPRMETEILVEQVLKASKNFKNPKLLDIGTGSGAIAIAIAKNSDMDVTAVDVSKSALITAENNAKKNDVKIEFLHSNLFDGLKRKRKFDIIVSNPPYIKTQDIKKLDKNVRECDPILALDGGEDGLDFYREITQKAINRLNAGGLLFYEIGKGQGSAVRKIMRENGFDEIRTIKDYNKIERVICGKYK